MPPRLTRRSLSLTTRRHDLHSLFNPHLLDLRLRLSRWAEGLWVSASETTESTDQEPVWQRQLQPRRSWKRQAKAAFPSSNHLYGGSVRRPSPITAANEPKTPNTMFAMRWRELRANRNAKRNNTTRTGITSGMTSGQLEAPSGGVVRMTAAIVTLLSPEESLLLPRISESLPTHSPWHRDQ